MTERKEFVDWLELESFLRRKYVIRKGGSQSHIDYITAALDDLVREITRHVEKQIGESEIPF